MYYIGNEKQFVAKNPEDPHGKLIIVDDINLAYICSKNEALKIYHGTPIARRIPGAKILMVYENESIEKLRMVADQLSKDILSVYKLLSYTEEEIQTNKRYLLEYLSYVDKSESDILHALTEYQVIYGKRPSASKMAKASYLLQEIRNEHSRTKECLRFLKVLETALKKNWNISKIQMELNKVRHDPYKGRTSYYEKVMSIFEEGIVNV